MNDLNKEFDLKIFKCKNVKDPVKAWEAAGWDFFVPENLTLKDFGKNSETFFNKNNFNIGPEVYGNSPILFVDTGTEKYEVMFSIQIDENENYKTIMNVFQNKKIIGKFSYDDAINDKVDNDVVKNILKDTCYIYQIIVDPAGRVLIPSGVHVNLPENVFLKAENKSGIAAKRGLTVGSSVVDQDYEGEIHISLINTSNNAVFIKAGEKIVQFVPYFQPIMKSVINHNSLDELYKDKKSQRGAGGFGSSGN